MLDASAYAGCIGFLRQQATDVASLLPLPETAFRFAVREFLATCGGSETTNEGSSSLGFHSCPTVGLRGFYRPLNLPHRGPGFSCENGLTIGC